MAKLTVHDLGKTFRPIGKWSWLAGLQDDGTDDETDGRFTKAWGLRREITAFSNVSISLNAGEALGIVGPPISGKTSLLRVIAGLTAPTTGYVTGQGSVVYMNGLRQAPYPKLSLRTNLEAVAELCIGQRLDRRRRDASIKKAADVLDMHSRLDTASYWFHPTQFGSLAYAMVIAFGPDIMLFDEILHPGEPEASEWIIAELRQHLHSGGIVVVASRRAQLAKTFSSKLYDMGGKDAADNEELAKPSPPTFVEAPPLAAPPAVAPVPSGEVGLFPVKPARSRPIGLHSSTDGYFLGSQAPLENHDAGQWQEISSVALPQEGPGSVAPDGSPDEEVVGTARREVFSAVPGLGMLKAVRTRMPSGREVNQLSPGETVVVDVYFDILDVGVEVEIAAEFSVAPLGPRRHKLLASPNKVAVAGLPAPLSSLPRGSYRASCYFDGQFMEEAPVSYLVTADLSITFRDERARQRHPPPSNQILDAQVHWMVRSDWAQDIPSDNYDAARTRVATLFPALRWEIKYDASGSMETTDAGVKDTR